MKTSPILNKRLVHIREDAEINTWGPFADDTDDDLPRGGGDVLEGDIWINSETGEIRQVLIATIAGPLWTILDPHTLTGHAWDRICGSVNPELCALLSTRREG